MIRDIVRFGLAIVTMTIGAGLLVETRYQLACIDVAHRQHLGHHASQAPVYAAPQPPQSTIGRFGRAWLELADAALGILR